MSDWKKIEALLFASGKYMPKDEIIRITGIPKNKISATLKKLQEHYDSADTSLKLFSENDSWKLNVKEDYSSIVNSIVSETELPGYAMATLALIAYKSPVLQSEIINSRGSGAYEHIKLLEEKGFISKEKHGRSYKLKVSDKFFEYFDVKGESGIGDVFKDVKKQDSLGGLSVYKSEEEDSDSDSEEENAFSSQVLERLKRVDKPKDEDHHNRVFIDSFEKRIGRVKSELDKADREFSGMKRDEEEQKEIFEDDTSAFEPSTAGDEDQASEEDKKGFLDKINKDIDRIAGDAPEEDETEESEEGKKEE